MPDISQKTALEMPADLPPALSVLMGVNLLYWKVQDVLDHINITPKLSKNERQLFVMLATPQRMGLLASEMQILPSTLTAIANGLEEKGLMIREADPNDRRVCWLTLTKDGVKKRQTMMERATKIFTEVAGLQSSDTEALSKIMVKITNNIKANGLPEGAKICS